MTTSLPRPTVSLGHVIVKTSRLSACVEFYIALGLTRGETNRPQEGIALLQLRGGTDLILIASDHPMSDMAQESRVSYGDYAGPVDLLIASGERGDLDAYRVGISDAGLSPSDIEHDPMTNHHFFTVVDPDGRKVTVLTNHANYEVGN